VLGGNGRGIVSHFRLDRKDAQVEVGTFSKAFGVVGSHNWGSRELVNFARDKSRTLLPTGSSPSA
jgi:7-keto-8-aminopelargonate synthetase-like enzyme